MTCAGPVSHWGAGPTGIMDNIIGRPGVWPGQGQRGENKLLYDDLIEIAREKQHRRRLGNVHKSVPHPQILLVVGDEMASWLDALYQQVASRWSSSLSALQVIYCSSTPYVGTAPVQQMTFSQLKGNVEPTSLRQAPELLHKFNQIVAEVVEKTSHTPGLRMNRANIHVVLQPQSPLSVLVQDLIAVVQGHLAGYGAIVCDSRIYLLLPDHISTGAEKENTNAFLEQMLQMSNGAYEQPVLLQQRDGAFTTYTTNRLVQYVMLLDEWNEYYQRYDLHGERIQLVGDLIETSEWMNGSFLQTVGVQETHAGPEYWLAAAASQLYMQAEDELEGPGTVDLATLQQAIQKFAEQQMQGLENIFDSCCVYRPFHQAGLRQYTIDQVEERVFGKGMEQLYTQWLEHRNFSALPAELDKVLQEIPSIVLLEQLSHQLDNWANELEAGEQLLPALQCDGLTFRNASSMDTAARQLRQYIVQNKYSIQGRNDGKKLQRDVARLCAQACRERMENLQHQQVMIRDFGRELQQVWYQLRDSFNEGRPLPVQWLGQTPDAGLLRQCVERSGANPQVWVRDFLETLADRVDLNGQKVACTGEAPLCCRLTIGFGLQTQNRDIQDGISAGRTLRFAALSPGEYTDGTAGRSFLLHSAQE